MRWNDCDFCFSRGTWHFICYFNRVPEGIYPQPAGTWWGAIEVTDKDGREWHHSLPRMVINDFGDLVDQTTGARP